MKDDKNWGEWSDRLVTCTPGNSEEIVPLQSADLIAYETFKLLDPTQEVKHLRASLRSLLPHIVLEGKWWNAERIHTIKPMLANAELGPNRFIALWEEQDLDGKRFQIA